MLLVHGFASSFALNWERNGWVDLLRDAGREVIAVDLLGHGTAPKPYDPSAYEFLEERVLEALRNHHTARLRVTGMGEFDTFDRSLMLIRRRF